MLGNLPVVVAALLGGMVGWLVLWATVVTRIGVAAPWVLVGGMIALLAVMLTYVNVSGTLDVGAEGLFVDWRGQTRYVSFADLRGASVYRARSMGKRLVGVRLDLFSAAPVDVLIGEDQFGASDKAAALAAHVEEARVKYDAREARDASTLERRDLTTDAWVTKLRRLGAGANAGPREATITDEALWGVVEDARARPDARAGAAIALSGRLDDAGRVRLRVAAAETASPRLRIALATAAVSEEGAFTEVLDDIAVPEQRLQRER